MFSVMTNIENRCAKILIFIIHYFDTDPLGTGFKSFLQADWLFFSENKLEYIYISRISKPLLYGVKTWGRHSIKRKRQVKMIIMKFL